MRMMEKGKMHDTTDSAAAPDSSPAAARPEDVIPSAARDDTLTSAKSAGVTRSSEELLQAILLELRRQVRVDLRPGVLQKRFDLGRL